MKNTKLTMIQLFELFDCLDSKLEEVFDIQKNIIAVKNQIGEYSPILGLIRKKDVMARFVLEDNLEIICSLNHLIMENGELKRIKDSSYVDTCDGCKEVIGVEILGEGILYDISLPNPHLYITTNGIIHHNTTLAKVILNELNIPEQDQLILNASRENSVDVLRGKVTNFISVWPVGDFRVVLMDEADYLSQPAQAAFRGEIERFSDNARFIFTLNYPHKIIPPLHGRFQTLVFDSLDMESYVMRMMDILTSEKIEFDADDLNLYVNKTYPDLRKCINLLDQNCFDGKLHPLVAAEDVSTKEYLIEAHKMFVKGDYTRARKLIVSQAQVEEYENIYKYFYQHLDMFGNDDVIQSDAVVLIAKGLKNHGLCADPEINLAATMIELSRVGK